MLIVQNTEHFRIESPSIVTIGTFDGVHRGHQKILAKLLELKALTGLQTVVLTFEPHPRKVLFPEQNDLKLITGIDEKLELLKQNGVDVTVVYPFSKAFSQLPSEDYISIILQKSLHVKHLVIGYDHKFGLNRSGDIHTLKKHASTHNFTVEEISAEDIDNITVSSSKIRKAIEEGQIELATEFLGHRFFMKATVVKGKQLGRTLGYPTANLIPLTPEKIIPKTGVYFVSVTYKQQQHYGMMSIGTNPTTDHDASIKLEVHVFDFNEDLYGEPIQIEFIKRIREEKKYNTLNELTKALDEDKETCMTWLPAYT